MALHNTEVPFGNKPASKLFSIDAIISTPSSTARSSESSTSSRKHRRREGKRQRSVTPERSPASPRRQHTPEEEPNSTSSPTAKPIPVYPISITDSDKKNRDSEVRRFPVESKTENVSANSYSPLPARPLANGFNPNFLTANPGYQNAMTAQMQAALIQAQCGGNPMPLPASLLQAPSTVNALFGGQQFPGFPVQRNMNGFFPPWLLGRQRFFNGPPNMSDPSASSFAAAHAHVQNLHGFLFHPYRKPKRIRTAFSPSQLLRLEHAFEKNHYVVGTERKQLAQQLGLSETQVKIWFQNRRTKHKRLKTDGEEEGANGEPGQSHNPESDEEDMEEEYDPSIRVLSCSSGALDSTTTPLPHQDFHS
ncbi:hypothetical protein RvY_01607 [Ramazzottius varieornatus]|uniref:Homeobox domain-containing protein n=1 Tax=Ramazzottius varieornatus TaxID=947166 RepID=A0A1D1US53_RAMVA|nr:hypothetical protein RvY_01607 [Ramazzottius varieornatus]